MPQCKESAATKAAEESSAAFVAAALFGGKGEESEFGEHG